MNSVTIQPLQSSLNQAPIDIIIPGSKSHTIRALLLALLAKGTSTLYNPLIAGDTESCLRVLRHFGVQITETTHTSTTQVANGTSIHSSIESTGLELHSAGFPDIYAHTSHKSPIDIGNSGTTLYFATALAGLSPYPVHFEGDSSLRTRTAAPLLEALQSLGAHVQGEGQDGCVPYSVHGPIHHGSLDIVCHTSQYVSALLIALSLVKGESVVRATLAGEYPYIDMTINWLRTQKILITHDDDYHTFTIQGGATIQPFTETIPGDFSAAVFFIGFVAITGYSLRCRGLEQDKTQADMQMLDIFTQMGGVYTWEDNNELLLSRPHALQGGSFDLSAIPDSLPMLSVMAVYANSPTRLYNVAHARKKETDRIATMTQELRALGAQVEEYEDGMKIIPSNNNINATSPITSGIVDSHHDHRIAMALAIGAVRAQGPVTIQNAQAVQVTFPSFFDMLTRTGVTCIYKDL